MRIFSCSAPLQDASSLPWVYELPPIPTAIPVWGEHIVPQAQYSKYTMDEIGFQVPIGEPISYTWSALLDPADTLLPDWITETTPVSTPNLSTDTPGLIGSIKSALGF